MDIEPIVIILDNREVYAPEQIVFKTVFRLTNQLEITSELQRVNQHFLNFLARNNIESAEGQPMNMDANELMYSSPSYLITLTQPLYLLLEKYRDEHPELVGYVVSYTFSQKDRATFSENLTNKARQMAEKKAQQRDLVVGDVVESEEIKTTSNGWVVTAPLAARVNHFQQVMAGQYRFVFSAHDAR